MIKLEKILNRKSALPPPFKKTCPCTVIPPPFLICQIPPPREVIKLYSPPKKKAVGGDGDANHELANKTPEQSFYC